MKATWFWPTVVVIWILDHIPHFERRYPLRRHVLVAGKWVGVSDSTMKPDWVWVWHHGMWSFYFLINTRLMGAFSDEMRYRAQRAEQKKRSSAS